MGNDPQTSVTTATDRCTESTTSLWQTEASLLTNGGFNPVLTIMAVGYWVSDYITKTWNGTEFKS